VAAPGRIEDFQHGRVPRPVRERQIVELAEQLFAERGYSGASMDELARRAGVTKPVVYELFESKDGLFRACVDRSAARMGESIAAAVRAETEPQARLRAGGLAFLRFRLGEPCGVGPDGDGRRRTLRRSGADRAQGPG
jgi:AcrR family transcriptional regulator